MIYFIFYAEKSFVLGKSMLCFFMLESLFEVSPHTSMLSNLLAFLHVFRVPNTKGNWNKSTPYYYINIFNEALLIYSD